MTVPTKRADFTMKSKLAGDLYDEKYALEHPENYSPETKYGSKVSLLSGQGFGGSPTKDKKYHQKIGNFHGVAFGRKNTTKMVLD